jgi:hypothetical protein
MRSALLSSKNIKVIMKKLSIWAKDHPWPARLIIVISHILLFILAWDLGLRTASLDIYLSSFVAKFLGVLFCMACILYPIKGVTKGVFRHSYVRQKSADFVVLLTTFLMFTSVFNALFFSPVAVYWKAEPKVVQIVNKTTEVRENAFPSMKDVKRAMKKYEKQIRKDMRAAKKRFKQQQNDDGVKILLTILVVVGAIFLLGLIGSLSCTLSCNGQEGLAGVVFVLGLGGVITLVVITMKAIWKKKKLRRA